MYKVWDEEMIKYVLDFFTPENMRVDVVSKSFMEMQGSLIRKLLIPLDDSIV